MLKIYNEIKKNFENYLKNKMNIIGDIGNTEVKICYIDNNFIIKKKINIKTNEINKTKIKKNFKFLFKK